MVTPELLEYIRQQLDADFSKEVLTETLISHGWSPEDAATALSTSARAEHPILVPNTTASKSHPFLIVALIVLVLLILGIGALAIPSVRLFVLGEAWSAAVPTASSTPLEPI